jgi:hypothetical protein
MTWWQTLLTTAAGAVIGGTVVIAAEVLRQKWTIADAKATWGRERQAIRMDNQRGWLLEIQTTAAEYGRLVARIAIEDTANKKRNPDLGYGEMLVDEHLSEGPAGDRYAAPSRQNLRRRDQGAHHNVHEPGHRRRFASSRADAERALEVMDQTFGSLNDRVTVLLQSL